MMAKFLILNAILAFLSCRQIDKLPDKFKDGLLDFSVNKSRIIQQIEKGKPLEFGELWTGFNKINVKTSQDTLIIDVNVELLTPLNYDGGYEVAGDTLFLYAKRIDKTDSKETVHSTLTYKILSKGLTYNEVDFKPLN